MSRRLVVVLFLDLVGWTRLAESVDPEPLQQMLERYYEICSTTVDEHGGVVEKFIGDAIMAVFGATTSQEDDALRALRTAFQIRADVGELRTPGATVSPVEIHCGIAAGEALVTRSVHAGMRVVGDVVNVAARLQSAAGAGEVLVNETVAHLARPHFAMVPVAPLTLKGKAEPVPALRVAGATTIDRVGDGPRMVNRGAERAQLRAAYHRVTHDRRSRLVAVLGPPGIGKTRLVTETVAELGPEPTVVFGSCPSYGANGNYVALAQLLDALTRQATPSRDIVRANGHLAAVLDSLRSTARSRREATGPGPGVEEMSWAARELLATAANRPLVVVWDSLEWAGPSLLRLIGELADSLRAVPLLMICVARPELADRDVAWVRDLSDGDVIDVGALAPTDSAALAASLATGGDAEVQPHDLGLVDRVAGYSAGNPLFIRLLVESAIPGRPLDEVPATITAMVGAMIDRLPPPAQQLLGAASVIGPAFTLAQLASLGQAGPETGPDAAGLGTLRERGLVRATGEAGEYCIVQQPVHEVVYGRLEKEQRYQWHRRLAEHDVSPAFHFEAAVRLLSDLRPGDTELPRLSRQAAAGLLREGTAALRQRDIPAAIGLLDRALNLAMNLAPDGPDRWRSVAAIRLSDALMLSGDTQRAVDVVTEVARTSPDERVARPCLVQQHLLAVRVGQVAGEAIDILIAELDRDPADRLAWCRFEQLRTLLHLGEGRFGAAEQATRAALEHARAMGDAYEEDRLLVALCEVRQWSPTPIVEKLAGCTELVARFADDRFLLVPVLAAQARCLALTGDPAGARAALAEAGAAVEQLRLTMGRILIDQAAGLACSLDGAHVGAQQHYRAAADALEQAGYAPMALTLRVQAARENARQQPSGDAAAEIAALLPRRDEMDVRGRILCLSAAVRLSASAGDPAASAGDPATMIGPVTMIDDIQSLLDTTDDPCLRGEVYFDLAQAHRCRGNLADATEMAVAAIDNYISVGATRPLRTVQAWM